MISLNEAGHELDESRRKHWRDKQACTVGGYAERYPEEFALGRAIGPIQLLEELLGRAITPIEQLETRSLDELRQIKAELLADWNAKEANRS